MKKSKNRMFFIIAFFILFIGIGYAILQANLQINGTTKIANNTWDIHFENVVVNPDSVSIGTDDTPATIDSNNPLKVDFSVTLSIPGDFYEFTVDVENEGSINAMIGTLAKTLKVNDAVVDTIPDYLNYTVTYDDNSEILENHLLEAGDTLTYKVRVEFKRDIDVDDLPEDATLSMSVEPQFIQADDTAIKKPPYYACTFDGELVQGAEYISGQYTYRYMQEMDYSNWINITSDGWGVILTDATSTDPVNSRLCTSINNKPVVSMSYMFNNSQATSIDTSSFNTSNVINMSAMFYNASSLTTIDLSNFNTSNVINMNSMFAGCSKLATLELSNFNTSNVKNMNNMFAGCSKLATLDLSNFDTSNVIIMRTMFRNCSSLTILDLSNFNTSKVTDMGGMFASCSQLEELNLSGFDFSKYSYGSNNPLMSTIASDCPRLKKLNVSGTILPQDCYYAFGGLRTLETIVFDNVNTSNVTNMNAMFLNCSNLTTLDLSDFDTSNVTNMTEMFNGCNYLKSIDVANWNTANVTDMSAMFLSCSALTTLDLSIFNTSKVTNMAGMLGGCSKLENLNLSGFDFRKYNKSYLMMDISNGGFQKLKTLNMSGTILPQNCSFVFGRLGTVETIIFDSVNTSNVTDMSSMFNGCSNLTTLDLSDFNISNVTNMNSMFNGCTSLTTGYAGTQTDADRFNNTSDKPSGLTFVVKP